MDNNKIWSEMTADEKIESLHQRNKMDRQSIFRLAGLLDERTSQLAACLSIVAGMTEGNFPAADKVASWSDKLRLTLPMITKSDLDQRVQDSLKQIIRTMS
ncbi:MAG: hypothetical protein WDN46_19020 [Methylocella sp.]